MAATGLGNSPFQTAVPLTMSGTVANAGTLSSSAFAIPVLNSGTALCDRYDLELVCNSFTPASIGSSYVQVNITTNKGNGFDPLLVSSGGLFPADVTFGSALVNTGTLITFKELAYPALQSGSVTAQLNLLNEAGVSLIVTSATMYPHGGMAG